MPRYRWVGASDTEIPDAKVVVQEGDEFSSPVEIAHPHAVLIAEGQPEPAEGPKE